MDTKKTHIVQIYWFIIAALLFAAGVFSYFSSNRDIIHFSRILGVAMLLVGILNFIACHLKSYVIHGVHWLKADAIITVFLSVFPLFNSMIFPDVIPFFFGVWELVSGILKFMDTSELKHDNKMCWRGFAIISTVEILSGTMSLLKPIEIAVGFNHIIGIIFFVQSVGFMLKTAMYKELTD